MSGSEAGKLSADGGFGPQLLVIVELSIKKAFRFGTYLVTGDLIYPKTTFYIIQKSKCYLCVSDTFWFVSFV